MMMRAENFIILRRKAVEGYDISFLITNFHTEQVTEWGWQLMEVTRGDDIISELPASLSISLLLDDQTKPYCAPHLFPLFDFTLLLFDLVDVFHAVDVMHPALFIHVALSHPCLLRTLLLARFCLFFHSLSPSIHLPVFLSYPFGFSPLFLFHVISRCQLSSLPPPFHLLVPRCTSTSWSTSSFILWRKLTRKFPR